MSQAHTRQSKKPTLVIVSPALARANNGNWQTAKRYRQLLQAHFQVRLVSEWHGEQSDDLMIATRRLLPGTACVAPLGWWWS